MGVITRLDALDYVVCGTLVILSLLVGIYHTFKARRLTDVRAFLISSSDVGLLPIIFSAVASQLSAIGTLGIPSEIYQHGIAYSGTVLGIAAVIPFGAYLYLPVFHDLKTKSIYQYLEWRFGRLVRRGAAITDILSRLFHASISMYAPAVALNQVTGLHVWASVLLIGITCVGYTSLGGIKAIIWTDVCQLCVMVATILIILVKSSHDFGGIEAVWQRNVNGGRVNFVTEKESYYTPWTTVFAGAISFMPVLITSQMLMQRYMSKGDLKSARISFSGCCIGYALCTAFNSLAGLFVYAKYHDCDPLINGQVSTRDQMMALFSMESLSFITGLRGVFVAAMLCATLSTLSSLLNTVVVVTLEDIIRPLGLKLSEGNFMKLSKALALLYGILATCLVAVAENTPGIVNAIFSFYGVLMGPLFGIFTAGMLLPWVNTWGAIAGYVAAVGLTAWPTIGVMLTKPKVPSLPYSTAGCNATAAYLQSNSSYFLSDQALFLTNKTGAIHDVISQEPFPLYALSSIWYACWSCVIVLVVSMLISLLSGSSNPNRVNPQHLFPIVRKMIIHMPKRWRKWLGFSPDRSQHLKTWCFNKEQEMRLLSQNVCSSAH